MNDEAARQSRLEAHLSRAEISTDLGHAPAVTTLQKYLVQLRDLLGEARVEMTPIEWATYVSIGCNVVGTEAAKLLLGEADELALEDRAA